MQQQPGTAAQVPAADGYEVLPTGRPAAAVLSAQEAAVQKAATPITTGQYLRMLVLGLLPLIGLLASFGWAFGRGAPQRRSFARALLWLHGIALVLLIVGLCVWVLVLASRYAVFSAPVL